MLLGNWPSRAEAYITRAPVSMEPLQLPKVLMGTVVTMMEEAEVMVLVELGDNLMATMSGMMIAPAWPNTALPNNIGHQQ